MEQSLSSPQPEPADAVAEARRVLDEDEQQRMQECAAEIDAVLAKYGCRLEVTPAQVMLVAGGRP